MLMLFATGCDHSISFGPELGELGLLPNQPTRMTYNSHPDRLGGFTALGGEVFYTFCEDSKAEQDPPCDEVHVFGLPLRPGDVCLGALPDRGGGRILERCGSAIGDADSLKQYLGGTRLDDGSLVYIYATRRRSASFSINPGLYLLRPGAHTPIKLLAYRPAIDDLGIPARLLAAGGQRVVTLGGDGPEMVTIHGDNTATRQPIAAIDAVDPRNAIGARIEAGFVQRLDLLTGETTDEVPVPTSDGWEDSQATAVGVAGGSVVVAQSRTVFAEGQQQSRLVLLRVGLPPQVVTTMVDVSFDRLAVAPDEQVIVVEVGGDLYRYALP